MPPNSAVFLDRDGVLNAPIYNSKTKEYESPHSVEDLKIYPETFEALKELQKKFLLFIVSNQPSFAKGKVSLDILKKIGEKLSEDLKAHGIELEESYYCYHHPQGTVQGYTKNCECRKPEPYFLKKAAKDFNINLKGSWMIGDRDTDIECGKRAGCQTILVENPLSKAKQGKEVPTFKAKNISEAAFLILKKKESSK